jgi:hypothetical protein
MTEQELQQAIDRIRSFSRLERVGWNGTESRAIL